jgi:MFS family permease
MSIVIFGVSAIRPTVTYRALALGAAEWQVGVIAAAFALLSLVLAIPIGRLIDRSGEAVFIVLGCCLLVAVSFMLVLAQQLWVLGVAQAALGMAHVFIAISIQALIGNSEPSKVASRFGNFSVAVSLGQLVGPISATWVLSAYGDNGWQPTLFVPDGPGLVFLIVGVLQTVAVLLAASLTGRRRSPARDPDASDAEPVERVRLIRVFGFKLVPTAILVSVVVVSGMDVIIVYLPVYGEERGLRPNVVGTLLAVLFASTIVCRLFLGRLRKIASPPALLAIATAVPGLIFVVAPFVGQPSVLGALFVIAGLGLGVGQPTSMTWVANVVPQHVRGTALGLRLAGNRLAQILVPIVAGVFASSFGVTSVFWTLSVLFLVTAGVAIRAVLFQRRQSSEPAAVALADVK